MYKTLSLLLATSLAATVSAQPTPDVNPGKWETTSTVTMESAQFSLPPQTNTSTDCITAEDIVEGQTFLKDADECEILSEDLRSDGMDYSMRCTTPDGGVMTMDGDLNFAGDEMSGVISGKAESPMGPVDMRIELKGHRIGDC